MRIILIFLVVGTCFVGNAFAVSLSAVEPRPVTLEAIRYAADHQKIPPFILILLLDVEAGSVGLRMENDDGTSDLGPCQVNTINLADYAKYGITEYDLQFNGPLNVFAAAVYVRKQIDEAIKRGKSGRFFFLEGMGRYHSKTPRFKEKYQERLVEAAAKIKTQEDVRRIIRNANKHFDDVRAEWLSRQTMEKEHAK